MRNGRRAVKKLLLLGVGSALMFTMGGVGTAQADGGKHWSSAQTAGAPGVVIANAGAGKCASCHRAHTAKAEYLLKQAQPALCYTCHGAGTGSSTDVQTGVDSNSNGALRGGGFEKAAIGSGLATKDMGTQQSYGISSVNQKIPVLGGAIAAPVATTSRHQIDGTAGTAWGNGTASTTRGSTLTLECGSCHDPHGNGNYRILRPIPVDSGYAVHVIRPARAAVPARTNATTGVVTPAIPAVAEALSTSAGIKIPDTATKVYTTTNYWLAGDTNVAADSTALYTGELTGASAGAGGTAPDGYIANIANWCTTCHTRYLATTQSYKTDSGDPTYMYKHRSDANYKAGSANCITCHVSHGSNASMQGDAANFTAPDGTVPAASANSRLLRVDNRGTCVMCHNV